MVVRVKFVARSVEYIVSGSVLAMSWECLPVGCDFINANWIRGYKTSKDFIATQGPLPSTLVHFWQMVIDNNVKVIVMLSKLAEGQDGKCKLSQREGL